MKATKRIAVAGAISGVMGLAAVGFGSGAAYADPDMDDIAPLIPGGLSEDWQSYLPLLDNVADVGSIAGLGELGNIPVLGDIGNIIPAQDLLGLAAGLG
ncbi:hypothetical protein [Mycolicibacterium gadium]|jgi:hypothetical protein|uniref:Secreted protein n=2 Tax=Mycolicibacterium gadium TaxID=1794 RepID=A0A7I7WJH1_MYCGU|nr:hypothetical protein [Mycolicibacterium gadium]MDG5486776.1 hypothetical protein [Mycolicibacterium gadium]BBZ17092.1 hypothetical protein MGAD_14270 [Mycolicibacterium gadium]